MPDRIVIGVSTPEGAPEGDPPVAEQWCDRHWAPLRAGVEAGTHNGLIATPVLMEELLHDAEFERRTGVVAGGDRIDAAILNAVVSELAPICCYLGDEKMQEITDLCRRRRPGPTPRDGAV